MVNMPALAYKGGMPGKLWPRLAVCGVVFCSLIFRGAFSKPILRVVLNINH